MIDEQDLEKKLVEKITELQDELIKTFDAYRKASQNFDSVKDYQTVFEAFVINRLGMIELALDLMDESTIKDRFRL